MKVLVLSTRVPFVHGGAEELCEHLVRNLGAAGAQAEAFRIPFTWEPAERLMDEMTIARHLRLYNVDRVIALKFPAYLVPWPNKVLWLLHQYRQAYDLRDAGQSNIPDDARGAQILAAIRAADAVAFAEAGCIHTNAPITAKRLLHYNGVAATVLRPPLNDPELFKGGEPAGYVLATGRVNSAKRQHLLIEALRHAPRARLIIAGPPDSATDADALRRLAAAKGVAERVTLDLRLLPRLELANLVNNALAVAYLPFDEDSLGYCTMEAFHAGKPVLTTTDAGGVLDIVHDAATGRGRTLVYVMGSSLKIDVGVLLAAERRRLVLDEQVAIPAFGDIEFPEDANAHLDIERVGRSLLMTGTIDVTAVAPCTRCLAEVRQLVHVDVDEQFEATSDQSDPFAESNVVQGDEVDIGDLVRQLVTSTLPLAVVCAQDCRGLCPVCGNSKNDGSCHCPPETEGDHGES